MSSISSNCSFLFFQTPPFPSTSNWQTKPKGQENVNPYGQSRITKLSIKFMYQLKDSRLVCRVLRYLKSSPARGLFFSSSSSIQILVFSNVDWVGCLDTRRLISFGHVLLLGFIPCVSTHQKANHSL